MSYRKVDLITEYQDQIYDHGFLWWGLFLVTDIYKGDFPEIGTAAANIEGGTPKVYLHEPFFDKLNELEKLFVISHELLHILLDHFNRFNLSKDIANINIATDMALNQILLFMPAFEGMYNREKMPCLFDKLVVDAKSFRRFTGINENLPIPLMESAEKYYAIILTSADNAATKSPLDTNSFKGTLEDAAGVWEKVSKATNLSNNEIISEVLSEKAKKAITSPGKELVKLKRIIDILGTSRGNWRSLVRKLVAKHSGVATKTSWHSPNPLYVDYVNKDGRIRLPNSRFIGPTKNAKAKVLLFLDISTSCSHLNTWFYKAAESIPYESIIVEAVVFNTRTKRLATDKNKIKDKVYSNGGTSLSSLSEYIAKLDTYPEYIFVFTDAESESFVHVPDNMLRNRWYWFLPTDANATPYTRKVAENFSNVYCLEDYVRPE